MTHGHYLDRLLVPEGPYGILRRPAPHRPAAYERRQVRPPRRHAVLAKHASRTRRLLDPRLARFTAAGLDLQMRRRSLPALAAALGALGVRADWVVFGHVHRLGPLPRDRPADWEHVLAPGAAPTRFLNTGSWQNEPLLVGTSRRPHAYWPGGSVMIGEDGIPRALALLDSRDLGAGSRPGPRQLPAPSEPSR
jgi:hypothetical protein